MTELVYECLKENLESLKMRNTLEILDNYLERAIKDDLNIVAVLDHIFAEEAKNKRRRAYEQQIQLSGFPIKKTLDDFDFTFQPSIDKRQIEELATMRFVENARPSRRRQDSPGYRSGAGGRQGPLFHLLHQLPHSH
jgi:DNA replication protein DnaC